MADSVYISANLTKTQLEFLKLLGDHEIQLFKFSNIEKQLNQKFENLVHREVEFRWNRYGSFRYQITIADCFDQPRYSIGYDELIWLIRRAYISSQKLITYFKTIRNVAVTKHFVFLLELFECKMLSSFIDFAKKVVNTNYNLFDLQGLEKWVFDAKWGLRLNIARKELIQI
ncbi:hypothetical protein ACFSKL_10270 [Belliella marina]|uniref:Initiator Rep protein domain-containing protein n=1 Tax=Belliella marina TaxID=1644146 RepID=A0ABW4VKB7_9BACT